MPFDPSERVLERLRDEHLVWLTTIDDDGRPLTSLVWFLWDGQEAIVYSSGATPKVHNVIARPSVSLAFNSNEHGGDVATFTATARVSPDDPPVHANPAYLDKYLEAITDRLGMTPASFAEHYDTAVRIRPTSVRAW